MAFFALKPCNFGGFAFRIGEKVPAGLVAPSRVQWFIMNGYLAEAPETSEANMPEMSLLSDKTEPETVTLEADELATTEPEAAEKPRKNGKK